MAKNFRADLNKPTPYDDMLRKGEQDEGLPEGSLKLIMMIENRNNPRTDAVSPAGAQGLMQVMPANQKALGVTDPNDPAQSIQAAAKLMGDSYRRYNGDIGAAIADYNGGPRAAERYLSGAELHPETKQYMDFAREYIAGGLPSTKYGETVINAGIDQAQAVAPSDMYQNEEGSYDSLYTGLDSEAEAKLADEARFHDLSIGDAAKFGFSQTLTSALTTAITREEDPNYVLSNDQFEKVKTQFPEGISAAQEERIRNSRSQADFDYQLTRVQQENDFGRRMESQMGWSAAKSYAGVLAGGLFDPVALPLGTFGAAGRVIRGGGVIASAGRMAAEGAAATAIASPIIQEIDKGSISTSELMQHVGTGAIMGAGLGTLARVGGFAGKSMFDKELETAAAGRLENAPEYAPHEVPVGDDGLAVNFNQSRMTSEGAAGEIIGVGPTSVLHAADSWDESVADSVAKVQARRQAWYGSPLRQKITGWADSENVQLARSKSKVARWVGAQWAGDAAGLGKQVSRNAAVIKEQTKDLLEFEFTPALKEHFEAGMTPQQKLDYMAGGADDARAAFSREVQLERYRHRLYRESNAGSSKGYTSDAPSNIQQAAATLDNMYAKTKQMHIAADTEHAAILKDVDSVGYIEQRPDYIKLNKADNATKRSFLDMVKDDYHAEATAKVNKLKETRAEWIEEARKRFESQTVEEQPSVGKLDAVELGSGNTEAFAKIKPYSVDANGVSYHVALDESGEIIRVMAFKDGKKVGDVDSAVDQLIGGVHVDAAMRRQGIATRMYDIMREVNPRYVRDVGEDATRTDEGAAFRKSYDARPAPEKTAGKVLSKDAQEFLNNPEAYFDSHVEKLSAKIHAEMDKRASHWWENALRDPEARYQNSEASLMTLAREMSDEWFNGKTVDADLVKSFQDALTKKWADTSRRELNMLNNRVVNGQKLYMLDMFNHDVFAAAKKTINDTSGRVAMAKLGWKTEQDIADTLMAMAHSGATSREIEAAKNVSDIILNRAKGLDDSPLVHSLSNLTHSAMMGKLGMSVLADFPTAIANLGVGGMFDAMGGLAKKAMDGSLFVRNGRLTKLGSDLDDMTKGLMGHDNELWIPQALSADGFAMEAGGSLLRRSAAAARFTNTMSGANALSKVVGTGITRASNRKLHAFFRTGKGINEQRLADVGLHQKEISRIKAQFDKHAGKDNFGLDKWDDPLAKETLIASAHRFAQQGQMSRSYAGDLPQWTRNNILGYLFSRFRAIGIKAQEKVLVRNLTLADSNAFALVVGGTAFATFLAYARIHADAATSKDGRKVLKERLTPLGMADQVARFTSVFGLASEGTNILQILTGGAVQGGGDTPLTGAVQNYVKAAEQVGKAATGNAEWSSAAGAGMKLLPGANTYQFMMLKKAVTD